MIICPCTLKVKKEWAAAEKRRKKERRRQRKKEKRREKRKIKKKEQSSDNWHWDGWNAIDWERNDHQKKREYEHQMSQNFSPIEELDQHIVSGGLGRSFYKRKPCSCPCGCHKLHGDGQWLQILGRFLFSFSSS